MCILKLLLIFFFFFFGWGLEFLLHRNSDRLFFWTQSADQNTKKGKTCFNGLREKLDPGHTHWMELHGLLLNMISNEKEAQEKILNYSRNCLNGHLFQLVTCPYGQLSRTPLRFHYSATSQLRHLN